MWISGAIGGAAVLVLVSVGVLIRSSGRSASSPYPSPAVDIALGVANSFTPAIAADIASRPNGTPASAVADPPRTPPDTLLTTAPSVANRPPAPTPADAATSAAATRPSVSSTPLTTAQIVARWEPSVALVKGHASSGTGFVVRPGIIVTNAHVIGDEFISSLEVRFPSAPAGKQGPHAAELLYEDPRRDLAFLAVSTDLPATDVLSSYPFVKGDDITVIGNPGLGEEVVLENAITRGILSSKTVIDGQNFLQMSIAINPGNSGGPVFDSAGHVIGVATLKAAKAEAVAFCIPAEDLRSALAQVGPPRPQMVSQHRAQVGFKTLTVAGALYGVALDIRAALIRKTPPGGTPNLLPNEPIQKLDEAINTLDQKLFSLIDAEIPHIKGDAALAPATRGRYEELSSSYHAMKDLYTSTNRPVDQYASQVQKLRTKCLSLIESLQKDLKIDVPAQLLTILKARPSEGQSTTLVSQIVPPNVQSRMLRPRGALAPRGAIGSRIPAAPGRPATARDRMQDARDRLRSRARGNN